MTTALTQAAALRPFVGLAPFTEADARYFFGRDADRAVIVSNMVASRLTVLYGPSGCGKSSLLEAGVLNEVNKIVSPRQIAAHGSPEYVVASFHEWRDRPRDALLADLRERIKGVLERDIPATAGWRFPGGCTCRVGAARAGGTLDRARPVRGVLPVPRTKGCGGEVRVRACRGSQPCRSARELFDFRSRRRRWRELDALEGYVANLMTNTLRLDRLDRKRGRRSIVGPIDRYNELRGGRPGDHDRAGADRRGAARRGGRVDQPRDRRAAAAWTARIVPMWTPGRSRPPFCNW